MRPADFLKGLAQVSSQLNLSIKVIRFMVQTPKKKRKLPKNIADRPSHEVMERIFGKRIMREIDSLVDDQKGVETKVFKSTTEQV